MGNILYILASFILIFNMVTGWLLYFITDNQPTRLNSDNRISGTIDLSCQSNEDCQIKNVGNQCGYYPLCVNKNFLPKPPELNSMICGFPSIDNCRCIKNKCEGFSNEN